MTPSSGKAADTLGAVGVTVAAVSSATPAVPSMTGTARQFRARWQFTHANAAAAPMTAKTMQTIHANFAG